MKRSEKKRYTGQNVSQENPETAGIAVNSGQPTFSAA
jgi:hypothetical protein